MDVENPQDLPPSATLVYRLAYLGLVYYCTKMGNLLDLHFLLLVGTEDIKNLFLLLLPWILTVGSMTCWMCSID